MQINRESRTFQPGVTLSDDIKSLVTDVFFICGRYRTTQSVPVGTFTAAARIVKVDQPPLKKEIEAPN